MPLPTVAIVGRPNVGKSTLFNRLVGKKLALVDDRPGVTRDRREGEASLLGLDFRVIDTAGYEDEDPKTLPGRMRAQTEAAVREADAALFLVDARDGLTPLDEEIGRWLRAESTPVIVVANKAEGRAAESGIFEAFRLAEAEPERFENPAFRGATFRLVGDDDHRRAFGPQPAPDLLVERSQAVAGIDQEQGGIGLADRGLGLGPHASRQRLRVLVLEPRRVDHPEVETEQERLA